MTLTKKQRDVLREMFDGHCAYCGDALTKTGWHADHIEPIYRKVRYVFNEKRGYHMAQNTSECFEPEKDHILNLMPACRRCNCSKGAHTVEAWRKQLAEQPRMCRDYSNNFRWAEKFGLVQVIDKPVVFYFETYAAQQSNREEANGTD